MIVSRQDTGRLMPLNEMGVHHGIHRQRGSSRTVEREQDRWPEGTIQAQGHLGASSPPADEGTGPIRGHDFEGDRPLDRFLRRRRADGSSTALDLCVVLLSDEIAETIVEHAYRRALVDVKRIHRRIFVAFLDWDLEERVLELVERKGVLHLAQRDAFVPVALDPFAEPLPQVLHLPGSVVVVLGRLAEPFII